MEQSQASAIECLPPGTQRIEDERGAHIVLSPVPSSDPNQPLNWPTWRKALHMALLCFYCIFVFAVLTSATPLWVAINIETGVSLTDLNNAYAASSGALSVGCIFFVPLGLKFGRRPVYIGTALLMTGSAIWQARAQTVGDFVGANVLGGLAGCVNEALFQVTVSDMFFVHQRASANGLYLAAVSFGNYMGPVAAGYVADSQGWRWTFYYLTIFMGITSLAMIVGLEESKFDAPTVNGRSVALPGAVRDSSSDNSKTPTAKEQTNSTLQTLETRDSTQQNSSSPKDGYWRRHRLITLDTDSTGHKQKNSLIRHAFQPFIILVQFPAVAFAALQYGWLVAMLSVVAVTQATIYPAPPYNFGAASVGLMSLPPAIGSVLGSLLGGPLVDFLAVQVAKRRGGIHEPETRLWLFMIPSCGMIIGLLMYGLTIAKGQPWIINAIGAGFVGFALGGGGDMALTYVQDSYQYILGDALVGVVFVRNAISTALVFGVPPWITGMGIYDMFVICGVLAAVIGLTCVPLIVWGRKWRAQLAGKYSKWQERQY